MSLLWQEPSDGSDFFSTASNTPSFPSWKNRRCWRVNRAKRWVISLLHSCKGQCKWYLCDFWLHSAAQAKDKYTEMALQIRDYEVKKYEHWVAEAEHNLPLLMKKTLLITSENQTQVEQVCVFCCLLAYNSILCKTEIIISQTLFLIVRTSHQLKAADREVCDTL